MVGFAPCLCQEECDVGSFFIILGSTWAIFMFADTLVHFVLSLLICKYITSPFTIYSAFYMC